MTNGGSHPIIFYDGVCGLCDRLNQFVLKNDKKDRFHFAALQNTLAQSTLSRHGKDPLDLDTVYVVENAGQQGESLRKQSDAILFILRELGSYWKMLSIIATIIPRPIRNWAYSKVANNRYRFFGRYDQCQIPTARDKAKFIDTEF